VPSVVRVITRVDVMVGVLPYVPDRALHLLPRDVQRFEPRLALDGGPDGLALVRIVVRRSPRWVRPHGWLGLEAGGDQVDEVVALFESVGYRDLGVLEDADGDPRAVCGRLTAPRPPSGPWCERVAGPGPVGVSGEPDWPGVPGQ
jgi:methylase of polypeptide subunit release factors